MGPKAKRERVLQLSTRLSWYEKRTFTSPGRVDITLKVLMSSKLLAETWAGQKALNLPNPLQHWG
jgi:hypothetical protein